MKFVDEITLNACSGKGGDGVVRWAHLHGKPRGGPAGGDGGKGGDVYIRAVRDIALLSKYRGDNHFAAADGIDGGGNSLHGAAGTDVIIDLPVGSVVKVTETKKEFELIHENETVLILKGGVGGRGNEHFKSSRNIAPQECTLGKQGICSDLHVELKLIADAGFVGLPNAGKSSLLNALTNAKVKVGDYQFTTLDPSLGVLPSKHVLADIPGLIEGASEGRGLGHKFLRHVSRTKTLIHCISASTDEIIKTYSAVRDELARYDSRLSDKREIIVLTKSDELSSEELAKQVQLLQTLNNPVFTTSIYDNASIKEFSDALTKFLSQDA